MCLVFYFVLEQMEGIMGAVRVTLNILFTPQHFSTSSSLGGLWLTLANEMIVEVISLFHHGKKECQKKKDGWLHVATWEKSRIPNELVALGKETGEENISGEYCWFLAVLVKCYKKEMCSRKNCINFKQKWDVLEKVWKPKVLQSWKINCFLILNGIH